MARNEKRRQKRLMKHRRKAKLRQRAHAGMYVPGSAHTKLKIREGRSLPVHECLINPSWREHGLAHILISRRQPGGNLVVATYLVDTWCLGLKRTYCEADVPPGEYKARLRAGMYQEERPAKCPLPLAHQIIYGAIDYAERFGFTPDRDFRLSRFVLEERDSIELSHDIEFGKNGKPFYVSGPHDNPKRVIAQLRSAVGEGNFDFMIGGPPGYFKNAGLDMPLVFP